MMSESEPLICNNSPEVSNASVSTKNTVKKISARTVFIVLLIFCFARYRAGITGDHTGNSQLNGDIGPLKGESPDISRNANYSQDIAPKAIFRLFKRTHFSAGADEDAAFLVRNFGLSVVHNYTYNNYYRNEFLFECAKRLELDTAAAGLNFAIHIFESFVTPTGPISTKDWINYFVEMNSYSLQKHSWNAFMAFSTTFYTTDLTPYYEHLGSNSIRMLRIRYMNPIDGAIMYSISVVLPHTGHLIEVISDRFEKKYSVHFKQWPKSCCRQASEIGFSATLLQNQWMRMGGVNSGKYNLPSLMLVKISFPVANLHKMVGFFQSFDGELPVTVETGTSESNGINCTYATARVKTGEKNSFARYDVDVRAVDSPEAFVRNYSVRDWVSYVNSIHDRFTGMEDKGWDRYLDNHIGFMLETHEPLDSLFGMLNNTGVDHRAHVGHIGSNQGSVWTSGIDGQGVEFHGNFTPEFADTLQEIDYCSPTSESKNVNPTAAPIPKPTRTHHPSDPPYPKPTKTHMPTSPPYPKPTKSHVPSKPPHAKPTKTHVPSRAPFAKPTKTHVPSRLPHNKPTKEHLGKIEKTSRPTSPPHSKPTKVHKTHHPTNPPHGKPTKVHKTHRPSHPPHTHRPSHPPHPAPTKARKSSGSHHSHDPGVIPAFPSDD